MAESEIPKKYKHLEVEEKWRKQWDEWGIHRWDPTAPREDTFVVDTPPPTVSGSLHVGHVFSYTHQDLLVRYQRMSGKNIAFPMGWDDNGLPTERRVQNLLGIRCNPHLPYDPAWKPDPSGGKRKEIEEVSRRNFIEACALVTAEDEKAFEHLWRHLGLSLDWSEQYATIDDHCRHISQLSFLDLVEKNQVYNVESPTMWDIDFKTAVAQAEDAFVVGHDDQAHVLAVGRVGQHLVEGGVVIAAVQFPTEGGLVRELLGLYEIAPPDLGLVDAELLRQHVQRPFDDIHRLGHAKRAAVGDTARRLVRVDAVHPDVRNRNVVGTGADVEQPGRELARVGTGVEGTMIGEHVWDMNFEPDSNVIDVAIRRLRCKVDDSFARKLIHTVRGVGYRFSG